MHRHHCFVFRDDRLAPAIFEGLQKQNTLAGFACQPMNSVSYEDHYFDSPALALHALGMVCRIRKNAAGQEELTLERHRLGPGGETLVSAVNPFVGPGQSLNPQNLPEELAQILSLFTDTQPLTPVLTLQVDRKSVALQANGSSVATLHLDCVKALLPGGSSPHTVRYEVELISQKEPFPEGDMLHDVLCHALNLMPTTRSRAERYAAMMSGAARQAPQPIFLDMDTGVDDALAIILAMRSPEVTVLGITTSSGNIHAQQAAQNTCRVLDHIAPLLGSRYSALPPVAVGLPPTGQLPDASDVHGPDGLGGISQAPKASGTTPTTTPVNESALDLFRRLINAHPPKSVTLVVTGPLSNVAHWIQEEPQLVKRLKDIVVMGGVFFAAGNRSPGAEFNIHSDPQAARKVVEFCRRPVPVSPYVWRETLPLTFVGLDVTHQVRLWRRTLEERITAHPNNHVLPFIQQCTSYYMDFYHRNEGLDGCYLHDPLAVGYVIDPSFCEMAPYHVDVEDHGAFTSGMTVADHRPTRIFKDLSKAVTRVCYKVDALRFQDFFLARMCQ
uniref:CYTH domain-containing protein n=1 Tax=Desulfacinum infernum TaxID=35837 RepID=A0A832A1F4_9BACT